MGYISLPLLELSPWGQTRLYVAPELSRYCSVSSLCRKQFDLHSVWSVPLRCEFGIYGVVSVGPQVRPWGLQRPLMGPCRILQPKAAVLFGCGSNPSVHLVWISSCDNWGRDLGIFSACVFGEFVFLNLSVFSKTGGEWLVRLFCTI